MGTNKYLVLQNIFFWVQQKKETYTGLERHDGGYKMADLSFLGELFLQVIHAIWIMRMNNWGWTKDGCTLLTILLLKNAVVKVDNCTLYCACFSFTVAKQCCHEAFFIIILALRLQMNCRTVQLGHRSSKIQCSVRHNYTQICFSHGGYLIWKWLVVFACELMPDMELVAWMYVW